MEDALDPALGGESLEADELGTDVIETQATQFDRAKELFQSDGETLWDRFTARTSEMQRLYRGADITAEMQRLVDGDAIPDADRLRARLEDA